MRDKLDILSCIIEQRCRYSQSTKSSLTFVIVVGNAHWSFKRGNMQYLGTILSYFFRNCAQSCARVWRPATLYPDRVLMLGLAGRIGSECSNVRFNVCVTFTVATQAGFHLVSIRQVQAQTTNLIFSTFLCINVCMSIPDIVLFILRRPACICFLRSINAPLLLPNLTAPCSFCSRALWSDGVIKVWIFSSCIAFCTTLIGPDPCDVFRCYCTALFFLQREFLTLAWRYYANKIFIRDMCSFILGVRKPSRLLFCVELFENFDKISAHSVQLVSTKVLRFRLNGQSEDYFRPKCYNCM